MAPMGCPLSLTSLPVCLSVHPFIRPSVGLLTMPLLQSRLSCARAPLTSPPALNMLRQPPIASLVSPCLPVTSAPPQRNTPPPQCRDCVLLRVAGKLAPFFPPAESKTSAEDEECPICFMYYRGGLNHPSCCKGQTLCTECYLQVRTGPKSAFPTCPFCNKEGLEVTFEGAVTEEQLKEQQEEEQRVLELQIRMREDEIRRDRERQEERERRRAAGLPDLGPMTLDANGDIVAAPPPAPVPTPAPAPAPALLRLAAAQAERQSAALSNDDDDDLALSDLLGPERLGDLPPGAPGGRQWEMQQLEEIMMSEAIARSMTMEQEAAQAEASMTPSRMAAAAAADRAGTAGQADASLRDDTDALTREIEQAVRQAAAESSVQQGTRPVPEIAPVSEGPDEALLAEAETDDDLALALQMSLMGVQELEEASQHGAVDGAGRNLSDSPMMGTPPRISSRTSAQEVKLEASPVDRLPSGWESAVSRRTGEVYFVNTVTGERTFEPPVATRSKRVDSGGGASAETTPHGSPSRIASRSQVTPIRMAQSVAPPATATAPVAAPGSPVSPLAMAAANSGDQRQWIDGLDAPKHLADPVQQPQIGGTAAQPSDYVVDTAAYTVDTSDYTVDAGMDTQPAREPAPEPEQVPSAAPAVVHTPKTQNAEQRRSVSVAQFVDICGTDEATARFTLASVGFDLERAIDRHLSSATSADQSLSLPLPSVNSVIGMADTAPSDGAADTVHAEVVASEDPTYVRQADSQREEAAARQAAARVASRVEGVVDDAAGTTTTASVSMDGDGTAVAPDTLEVEMVNCDHFNDSGSVALSDAATASLQVPPTLAWLEAGDDDDEEDGDSSAAGAAEQHAEVTAPTIVPPKKESEHDGTDVDDEAVDVDTDLALALALSKQLESGGTGGELAAEPSAGEANMDSGGGADGRDAADAVDGSTNAQGAPREPTRAWID